MFRTINNNRKMADFNAELMKNLEDLIDSYIQDPFVNDRRFRTKFMIVRKNHTYVCRKYLKIVLGIFYKKRIEYFKNKGCDTPEMRRILSSKNFKCRIYFCANSTKFIINNIPYESLVKEVQIQAPNIIGMLRAKLECEYLGSLEFDFGECFNDALPNEIIHDTISEVLCDEARKYNKDLQNEIIIPFKVAKSFEIRDNKLIHNF